MSEAEFFHHAIGKARSLEAVLVHLVNAHQTPMRIDRRDVITEGDEWSCHRQITPFERRPSISARE